MIPRDEPTGLQDLRAVSVIDGGLPEACKDYVVDVSKPTFELPSTLGPMLFRISANKQYAWQDYSNGWPQHEPLQLRS